MKSIPSITGDILTNGINTNRGRAAQAMARLIEIDHKYNRCTFSLHWRRWSKTLQLLSGHV